MDKNDNIRTIHTRMYSTDAYEILNSVINQLCKGIWENYRPAEKYWRFAEVVRADDGETVLEIKKDSYIHDTCCRVVENGFIDMSDADVLWFFAQKLKQIVKLEIKSLGHDCKLFWRRDCTEPLDNIVTSNEDPCATVSMVYCVYDFLLDRKSYIDCIDRHVLDGHPLSPKIQAKNKKLRADYEKACSKLTAETEAKIEKLKNEILKIRENAADTRRALTAKYDAALAKNNR